MKAVVTVRIDIDGEAKKRDIKALVEDSLSEQVMVTQLAMAKPPREFRLRKVRVRAVDLD